MERRVLKENKNKETPKKIAAAVMAITAAGSLAACSGGKEGSALSKIGLGENIIYGKNCIEEPTNWDREKSYIARGDSLAADGEFSSFYFSEIDDNNMLNDAATQKILDNVTERTGDIPADGQVEAFQKSFKKLLDSYIGPDFTEDRTLRPGVILHRYGNGSGFKACAAWYEPNYYEHTINEQYTKY